MTPFALANVNDKSAVTVVVDQNILQSSTLALRAFSATDSMFIKSSALKAFLDATVPDHSVLDFANLSAPAAPAPLKKENSKSEKVDGGEKDIIIGMTVKKEENFPKWYEQVLVRRFLLIILWTNPQQLTTFLLHTLSLRLKPK